MLINSSYVNIIKVWHINMINGIYFKIKCVLIINLYNGIVNNNKLNNKLNNLSNLEMGYNLNSTNK